MKYVGSYEAKTHLPNLIEQVSRGEQFVITKHGVPVAMLSPIQTAQKIDTISLIKEIKKTRQPISLKGLSVKEMIEEGRKF